MSNRQSSSDFERPTLSICIPTFNRAEQLPRLLESIVCQDLANNVEVCISDNGSTDCTSEVVDSFRPFLNIIYRRNDNNLGFFFNYYQVIRLSTGAYVWCVGDDDVILPSSIMYITQKIQANSDVTIFHTPAFFHGRSSYFQEWPKECLLNAKRYKNLLLGDALYSPGFIGASIFKRNLIISSNIPTGAVPNSWPHLSLLVKSLPMISCGYVTKPLIAQLGDTLYWKPSNWKIAQFGKILIVDEAVSLKSISWLRGLFIVLNLLMGLKSIANILQMIIFDRNRVHLYYNQLNLYLFGAQKNFRIIVAMQYALIRLLAILPLNFTYNKFKFILPDSFVMRFETNGEDLSHEGAERIT